MNSILQWLSINKELNRTPVIILASYWTRRSFLQCGIGAALAIALKEELLCSIPSHLIGYVKRDRFPMKTVRPESFATAGRLQARPTQPTATGFPGLHPLNLERQRDGLIYVPPTYRANQPAPLLLMLHGAGGDAEGALRIVRELADPFGMIVLAVDSRQQTWDVIINDYGPDIAFLDRALAQTFDRYAINPDQVAIAGFSDGASYALSVGITNGDLFPHILAFSPGFMTPAARNGMPRCFISHGNRDTVLPIDQCSRRIVPQLQRAGYDVVYREFDGPHTVPGTIAREGINWFTA